MKNNILIALISMCNLKIIYLFFLVLKKSVKIGQPKALFLRLIDIFKYL